MTCKMCGNQDYQPCACGISPFDEAGVPTPIIYSNIRDVTSSGRFDTEYRDNRSQNEIEKLREDNIRMREALVTIVINPNVASIIASKALEDTK